MVSTDTELTLLEDRERVAAYDEALKLHSAEALRHWHQVREDYRRQDIDVLDFCGWPLRPLFIKRSILDFLCSAIHRQLDRFRKVLLEHADDPAYLTQKLALPQSFLEALDLVDGLSSPDFLTLLRPDGFLYADEYLLSEINFGNGAMVSCGYSETLCTMFRQAPIFQRLGWPVEQHIQPPFQAFLELVASNLKPYPDPTGWLSSPTATSTKPR